MGINQRVREVWNILAGTAKPVESIRKTVQLPSILTPYRGVGAVNTMPKPTAANLRRFAETPLARRAINVVKDRIASMDWQVRVRRGYDPATLVDADAKLAALRRSLEEPNAGDSFRTLIEQVLDDVLVGGFGAIEMKPTGDPERPFELWAVDGAAIQVDS